MPSVNICVFAGHLCAKPEVRSVGDTSVAKLRLVIDDSYKSKYGEKVDRAVFLDVEAWGKTADLCASHLDKGAAVLIEGRLQEDKWDDKETGQKRSRLKVRADRVQFLSRPKQEAAPDNAPAGDDMPF